MRPRVPDIAFEEGRNRSAVAQAFVFSGFLWWFTWTQFVTRFLFGWPYLTDAGYSLTFYEKVEGYPLSLVRIFLVLSVTSTLLALTGVWITSMNSRSKWRQRFLVTLFGTICCAFAYLPLTYEHLFLDSALHQRNMMIEDSWNYNDDGTLHEQAAERLRHLDEAIEKARLRTNR